MAAECWIKWQMKFPVNKCKCTQEETNPLLCLYSDGAELATTIPEQDLAGHSKSENNPQQNKKPSNTPHPQMKFYEWLEKRVENRTHYYAL